jgi:hypothetical protein
MTRSIRATSPTVDGEQQKVPHNGHAKDVEQVHQDKTAATPIKKVFVVFTEYMADKVKNRQVIIREIHGGLPHKTRLSSCE